MTVDEAPRDVGKSYPEPIDFGEAVVHQATGVVAVQLEIGVADAFRALVDAAAERELPVAKFAREIVDRSASLVPAASVPVGAVDLVRTDGTAVVYLRGEVDMALAEPLGAAIAAALSGNRIVVDLTHATFIDSTVIAALVAAHSDAHSAQKELTVVAGPETVMRTLQIGGVDTLFTFDGSASQ